MILLLITTLFLSTTFANTSFYVPSTTDDSQLNKRNEGRESMLCMDIRPQSTLNVEQITGRWYGNEIIMHTQDVPGIYRYDSCVLIHINDITSQMRGYASYNYNVHNREGLRQTSLSVDTTDLDQQQSRSSSSYGKPIPTKYIRLVWAEKDDNLEYTFNYTDVSPGYWMNVGEQRGSLVASNQYSQFTGSVQVVKAVNNHLVLTFCGNDVRSTIYTIVLSRTPKGLAPDELRSIRNLLGRRGLSTDSIRQVCDSGAAHLNSSAGLVAILLMYLLNKLRVN